jgi:hypothetical protein
MCASFKRNTARRDVLKYLVNDSAVVRIRPLSPHSTFAIENATKHFHKTKHPVMRSFEPGETWCYIDQIELDGLA